ncbi:hypothetical protein FRC00_009905 [Tulasnella sp. 408]|nr:hypothetical protein FRC00_009905 [Tulasnella sp. 408]
MTGFLPFEDVTSDIGVVERVIEGKVPSLVDDANLALIKEVCSLMEMCWKIRPTERPTADSCRKAISGIVREPGGPVHVTKKEGTDGGTYSDIYEGELEQPDGSKIGVAIKRIRYYREFENVEAVSKHGSLTRYISMNKGMKDSVKLKLLCDAARGLGYLHSLNPIIIHGDIKPDNVLVMDNFDGALCDFGVSRLFAVIEKASGLTTTGTRIGGTAGYQAKELLEETGPSASAPGDLYAFGGLILATRLTFIFVMYLRL